jgi:hypothetical protein
MQNRAGRRADSWEGTMGELCKESQGYRSSLSVVRTSCRRKPKGGRCRGTMEELCKKGQG